MYLLAGELTGAMLDVIARTLRLEHDLSRPRLLTNKPEPALSTDDSTLSLDRVLIVDDDRLVGRAILRLMKGRDAIHVQSGAAALDALKEFDAQAILCDVNMPQMNGPELFRRLRAQGSKLPFALITGGNLDNETEVLVREQEIELIQKPFDRAQINSVLDRMAHQCLGQADS